jgi:RNA methyltransferase, TrmH family
VLKVITSRDNELFRSLLDLSASGRERRTAGLALAEGIHLVEEYLACRGSPRQLVVSDSGRANARIGRLIEASRASEAVVLGDRLFSRLSQVSPEVGILAVIETGGAAKQAGSGLCVMLDGIQDPGNVGSILRSAAAAGADRVWLSTGCADPWAPKVLRGGMGAHFRLGIEDHADLAAIAREFAGRVIAASVSAARSVFDADLSGNLAFVFGSEGAGVSGDLLSAASETVKVPMPGGMESLNAAAAAAVCLFEAVRQRQMPA